MKIHNFFIALAALVALPWAAAAQAVSPDLLGAVQRDLVEKHGAGERERIEKGTRQLASQWNEADGDFRRYCLDNFMSGSELSENFERLQHNLSITNGALSLVRALLNESNSFTDTPSLPVDDLLRGTMPRVAGDGGAMERFVHLNFPYYTKAEKDAAGASWSREKWAMVNLGARYPVRGNARGGDGDNPYAADAAAFRRYIDYYFFDMERITDARGRLLFTDPISLHSHRGLRDYTKDEYSRAGGYDRQVVMNRVIESITDGSVPVLFLSDKDTRWNPFTGKLWRVGANGRLTEIRNFETEGTHRYAGFAANVHSKMLADADGSTMMTRIFDAATLPYEQTEAMIRRFLSDPVLVEVGKLIERRLGRGLQPFDIWYAGFQEQSAYSADYLDSLTKTRYPTPMDLQKDLGNILVRMGFPETDARFVGERVSVRPIVSGGYSSQPPLPGGVALMTTMWGEDGLDYKSYRVGMHELGHTVCGVYCTNWNDYFVMAGVPSGGINEGYAEMLAYRNTDGLGLFPYSAEERRHLLDLAAIWYLVEMGGQALVDIESWKWMYAHPGATPAEVRSGIMGVAEDVWNQYFAPIFGGVRDQHILSIYNHYITGDLYLHNYFMGNVVMYQMWDAFEATGLSDGLKRAAHEGRTLPQRWMRNATGSDISIEPLMRNARPALDFFAGE